MAQLVNASGSAGRSPPPLLVAWVSTGRSVPYMCIVSAVHGALNVIEQLRVVAYKNKPVFYSPVPVTTRT